MTLLQSPPADPGVEPRVPGPPGDGLVQKALSGGRLSGPEALDLWRRADLHTLGRIGASLRQRRVPGMQVTFLIDRNINYTNACVTDCLFCNFYRPPGDPEAYVLSRDILAQKITELAAVGGTRILLQGGHNPALRIGWYEDLLRWMHATFPSIAIDGFSPSEIDHIARLENLPLRTVLERLQAAGLTGLPGGGGEILDDAHRQRISRKKQSTEGWLETMRHAQALGLATSATMVIGSGESMAERLNHLLRLRTLQDESLGTHGNGFTSFIVWTMQTARTGLGRLLEMRGIQEAGAHEYLRHLAWCRVVLDNFTHVGASWPTQGEKVAQLALHFGADDFGSTMLEENVVSAAGAARCRMSEAEIRRTITDAGFVPVQRDTRYRPVAAHGGAA